MMKNRNEGVFAKSVLNQILMTQLDEIGCAFSLDLESDKIKTSAL